MKRILIALAIILTISSIAQAQDWTGWNTNYKLRCFPTNGVVANQTYTNLQVLGPAEGCWDGSLSVVDTNIGGFHFTGALNKLKGTLAGIGDWTKSYLDTNSGFTRSLGLSLFSTFVSTDWQTKVGPGIILCQNYPCNAATTPYTAWIDYNTSTDNKWENTTSGSFILSPIVNDTTYSIVLLMGGFDSSGVPFKQGDTKTDFLYGSNGFMKGGPYTSWTLVGKSLSNNYTPIYASINGYNAAFYGSNILIPTYDFSAVLQPSFLDLFASAFGAPDVGATWTQQSGVWSVSTGKAVATTAGIATFQGPAANVMYDTKITTPASGTTGAGQVVKWTDSSNYWYVQIVAGSSNNIKLIEYVSGTPNTRSTASASLSSNTEYRVRIIESSVSPYHSIFVNEVAKGTYTTLGSGSTATIFGLQDEGSSNAAFDVVAIWALTSNLVSSEFAKFGM